MTLHLAPGSTLAGSTNLDDYPPTTPAIEPRVNLYCVRSLIYAENLPAYGFYCRHVKGLRLSNIQLRAGSAALRHAMAFDEVENLAIEGLDAAFWPGGAAMLSLTQTCWAMVRGCQPQAEAGTFLKLAGDCSQHIALMANDLSGAGKATEVAPEVPKCVLSVK